MKKRLAVLAILLSCVLCVFAAETAHARAQAPAGASADLYARGKAAWDAGDYAAALPLLTGAAEAGDVRAQWYLGVMYEEGRGVPRDYVKALGWYRRAAASEPGGASRDWLNRLPPLSVGPDGFRGLKWGVHVDDVGGLRSGEGRSSIRPFVMEAGVRSYRRAGDRPKVGGTPVDGPFYHFYRDRLYAAGFGVTSANHISSGTLPSYSDMEEFKRTGATVAAIYNVLIEHDLSEAKRGERIRRLVEGFHPVWGRIMGLFTSLYGEPVMKGCRYNYAYPASFTAEFGWDFPKTDIRLVFHHGIDTEMSRYDNLLRITRKTTYCTARYSSPEIDRALRANLAGLPIGGDL